MMPALEPLALRQELVEMTAPLRWVFAGSVSLGLGSRKDVLNSASQAFCSFRHALPKRLEHGKNFIGPDLID